MVKLSLAYPGRANFSYLYLQNVANRLYEKQKVDSARSVARLACLPFCDGIVTLLAGPTLGHPGGSTWNDLVQARQSEQAQALLARAKASTFFLISALAKVDLAMGVTHLPGADFLQMGSRWQKWPDLSSMISTHASIGIPAKPLQTKWTNKKTIGYYNETEILPRKDLIVKPR